LSQTATSTSRLRQVVSSRRGSPRPARLYTPTAEPPELTIVAERSGLVFPLVKAGSIWSA
jgi:hypothetical protein